MKYGVAITKDRTRDFAKSLTVLAGTRVLVGFPAAGEEREGTGPKGSDERTPEDGEKSRPELNNATLGYIHNTGAPEQNIPQREFMTTGVMAGEAKIENYAKQTMKKAMDGDLAAMERGFISTGIVAQTSIRNVITEGIPPPLADSTLRGRLRRHSGRKGEKTELANREAGQEAGVEFAKPLIDTKQLFNAISFVLRKLRSR